MDLGLLVIANLIMRTRLPPKTRADKVSVKEIVLDVPYLIFVLGSFLVRLALLKIKIDENAVLQLFWGVFVPCTYYQSGRQILPTES